MGKRPDLIMMIIIVALVMLFNLTITYWIGTSSLPDWLKYCLLANN